VIFLFELATNAPPPISRQKHRPFEVNE